MPFPLIEDKLSVPSGTRAWRKIRRTRLLRRIRAAGWHPGHRADRAARVRQDERPDPMGRCRWTTCRLADRRRRRQRPDRVVHVPGSRPRPHRSAPSGCLHRDRVGSPVRACRRRTLAVGPLGAELPSASSSTTPSASPSAPASMPSNRSISHLPAGVQVAGRQPRARGPALRPLATPGLAARHRPRGSSHWNLDEVGELLRQRRLDLSSEATRSLSERTEGWPALLGLAVAAATRSDGGPIAGLSGVPARSATTSAQRCWRVAPGR